MRSSSNLGSGLGSLSNAKTAAAPASMRAPTCTRPNPRAPPVTGVSVKELRGDKYQRTLSRKGRILVTLSLILEELKRQTMIDK